MPSVFMATVMLPPKEFDNKYAKPDQGPTKIVVALLPEGKEEDQSNYIQVAADPVSKATKAEYLNSLTVGRKIPVCVAGYANAKKGEPAKPYYDLVGFTDEARKYLAGILCQNAAKTTNQVSRDDEATGAAAELRATRTNGTNGTPPPLSVAAIAAEAAVMVECFNMLVRKYQESGEPMPEEPTISRQANTLYLHVAGRTIPLD